PPGLALRGDRVHGVIDLDGDQLGVRSQRLAELGRLDATRMALEQLDLEALLQSPDALTERRLGDVELLCRAADVAVLHDGQELMDLAELHRHSSEEWIVSQKILVQPAGGMRLWLAIWRGLPAASAATCNAPGNGGTHRGGHPAMASTFWLVRCPALGALTGLALIGMLGTPSGAVLAQDEVCPQRGGTIKTVDMNYADMDPTAQIDPHSYIRMVYDSLIDVTMDLEYRPGLAVELPEQVDDASYVFKVREGVTFHDGTPFDAEAVKYNVDRIVAGDVVTPHTGLWREWLDSVTVIDPMTVRFDLKRPWPDFYWGVASTLFFA